MHIFKINYYVKLAVIIIAALLFWVAIFWTPILMPYIPLLLSLTLLSFVSFRLYKYYDFASWDVVTGVIKNIEEKHIITKESIYLSVKEFYPEITYNYMYNGESCESSKVFFDIRDIIACEVDMSGNAIDEKSRPWYAWKEGSNVKVYVNPHGVCDSLLFVKMSKGNIYRSIFYSFFSFLLFLLWFYLEEVRQLLSLYL